MLELTNYTRVNFWVLSGSFKGYGEKRNPNGGIEKMIILKDVCLGDTRLAEELWVKIPQWVKKPCLTEGDKVFFYSWVTIRQKGDYEEGLWKPTELVLSFSPICRIRKTRIVQRKPVRLVWRAIQPSP